MSRITTHTSTSVRLLKDTTAGLKNMSITRIGKENGRYQGDQYTSLRPSLWSLLL
jgi:hypothetical protein